MRVRNHRLAVAALVAATAVLITACQPLHLTRPPGAGTVRYRDAVFTQVDKTADVTYGKATRITGSIQTLKLDVYQPRGDTITRRPAIVWVHGGSFKSGSKTASEIVDQATTFAKKGFVNVSIDYRLSKGCSPFTDECIRGIEMAYHDAQAAVRFLRANAATYKVDPTRIAIGGSSAGGITAYNVAYGSDNTVPGSNPGHSSKVRAAVSLSGASLTTGPSAGDPATMNFHGSADQVVPLSWNDSTIKAARAAKVIAERTIWKGDGHVPYAKHRQQILDETRNFLFIAMDLGRAAK